MNLAQTENRINEILEELERSPLPSSVKAIIRSREMLEGLSHPEEVDTEVVEEALSKFNPEFYAFLFRSAKIDPADAEGASFTESLHTAIVRLGFEEVKRLIVLFLAYSENVCDAMPKDVRQFASLVWLTAYKVGKRAAASLRFHGSTLSDEIFMLSMLQNIGVAALIHFDVPKYQRIIQSEKRLSLAEKERLAFGIDHYQLGKAIAGSWHLPKALRKSIQFEESKGELSFIDGNEEERLMFSALYLHKHVVESENKLSTQGNKRRILDPHLRYSEPVLMAARNRLNRDFQKQE